MKKGLGTIFSLFVFAILVFGLYGCSDDKVSKDVNSIKSRLEKIEDRLSNIEKSSKRVGVLEDEFQKLQQSMDAWERAITARLAPVSKKKGASQAKTVESRNKGKSYMVERGDSLFRIAQKHNMTVDQLCQLNKITKNTVLHPGVKLLVY
ncbi:MAG: LysM peptidoglycan-binding domain-containing protein [Deltaproteobacteria bacterium]|nr:LysM peptidoglycan-binding domain-containing protein [Deltaproteobacteria bacterium]